MRKQQVEVITVRYHFSGTRCGMGSGEFGSRTHGVRKNPTVKAAEATLKETGLIYSSSGLDEVHVSDDVRFSLRYSDDDHIARELGRCTRPLHAGPGRRGRPGYPRASTQAGPTATLRPGPGPVGWAMPVGRRLTPARAITTDARLVPQAATMNAAPGPASCNRPETSMTARALPPDLSLPRRRGTTGGDASLAGTEDGLGAAGARAEADSSARQNPSALLTFGDAAVTLP
jgi:hypothetical protein